MLRVVSQSAQQTRRIGASLAKALPSGAVLALLGNLGSGKTTLIKGLAQGLGAKGRINSPTFVLVAPHALPGKSRRMFFHVDLYRLRRPQELAELGFGEILGNRKHIVAIEWPRLARSLLPRQTIYCKLKPGRKPNERIISLWVKK